MLRDRGCSTTRLGGRTPRGKRRAEPPGRRECPPPIRPVAGEPPMSVTREVHADGWCVRLDLSGQVLSMEVPEFIFGWHEEADQAQPLLPTPPATEAGPVSAA